GRCRRAGRSRAASGRSAPTAPPRARYPRRRSRQSASWPSIYVALLQGIALASSAGPEIERLIGLLAKLPGLGPRSARRAALALLKRRDQLLNPLADALAEAARRVKTCSLCGSLDTQDPCAICADPHREAG